MSDPFRRFRFRRSDAATRERYRETSLAAEDLIWPVFCVGGAGRTEPIGAMPGVYRYSADRLSAALAPLADRGLKAVLLFGVPDTAGIDQAWSPGGIVQRIVPFIRDRFPGLQIITDVCLCSYSEDGHCHDGDNDRTGELLARIAVSHAEAGADMVAPSAMMDGQVYFIRRALDAKGATDVRIMSYAAKFASGFYGPFRDAAHCAPKSGDRRAYQMDPANRNEAFDEIAADIDQGADEVIVKPALSYLDIVSGAASRFSRPVVAYNVSGEYAMLLHAVDNKILSPEVIDETILSIKRAGASRIITYFVPRLLSPQGGHCEP